MTNTITPGRGISYICTVYDYKRIDTTSPLAQTNRDTKEANRTTDLYRRGSGLKTNQFKILTV